VAKPSFGRKGRDPFPDRIFTAVKRAFLLALFALVLAPSAVAASSPRVLAVRFDTEVNPVTQDYVNHEIQRANDGGYDAVVILLDTPGGLLESMRRIYQKELDSRIPVIVYVSPNGARAASAGVWISQAADLLAMAPQTNIGSSTPITGSGQDIGKDLHRKVVNDAAASLRSLAEAHGRNTKWAEAAVRQASNITAREALRRNVIDAIAPNLPALLRQVDGTKTKPKGLILHTAGATITEVSPSFFTRLLNVLIDPNLIFLLFLAGIAGIGYEIFHPGVVLPGALGAVALITALFGAFVLPINWAGAALILLGVVLLVLEAHVISHGALAVSGIISLVVGGLMLFNTAPPPYHISPALVVSVAVVLGGSWAFLLTKAIQVRRRPAAVGVQGLVGEVGQVRHNGLVFIRGELWQAHGPDGEPLRPGERVRVEAVEDGLKLAVRPEQPTVPVS
jgi:membrane-bound serine protease (ClpP class)